MAPPAAETDPSTPSGETAAAPARPAPAAPLWAADALPPGAAVGRFVVSRLLGAGGMGIVYQAHDPELNRQVAVKVLRRPRSKDSLRLLREAQALAQLQHPNVVAIHDVGMDGEQLYIAMELVDGENLEQHVRARRLDWRALLALFLQAARGLAAAHDKSIIHRDFKPANALVDRSGRVRVTDFGLARFAEEPSATPAETSSIGNSEVTLGDDDPAPAAPPPSGGGRLAPAAPPVSAGGGMALAAAPPPAGGGSARAASSGKPDSPPPPSDIPDTASGLLASPLTRASTMLGTPRYMAPEQRLRLPASARTDQYSLCISFWEALHGAPPFPVGHVPGGAPHRLHRSGAPRWLIRALVRGMAYDPAARHPSMAALIDLLERAPRRRRLALTAAAAALLVGGSVAFAATAARPAAADPCAAAGELLSGVWDSDVRTAVRDAFAASGVPFAADSFAIAARRLDGYAAAWRTMRVDSCRASRVRGEQPEAMLAARAQCLDRRRDELSALVELLRHADRALVARAADASGGLGPLATCADTAALAQRTPLPHDLVRRVAIRAVEAEVARVQAAVRAARGGDAVDDAAAAVARARQLDHPPLLAVALNAQGWTLRQRSRWRDAEKALQEALLAAEMAGDDERRFGVAVDLLSLEGYELEDDAAAQRYIDLAEALLRRIGATPLRSASLRCAISLNHWWHGRWNESLAATEACVAAREQQTPRDDAALARALQMRGIILQELDRNDEALAALERSLQLAEVNWGANHPDLANVLGSLGGTLRDMGRLDEAEAAMRRGLRILESSSGDSIARSNLLMNLGNLLDDREQLEDAVATFRLAIEMVERISGPEDTRVADALDNMGSALSKLGRHAEAEAVARRAIAIHEKKNGPDHPATVTSLRQLAKQFMRRALPAQALPLYTRALKAQERSMGADHPALARTLGSIAEAALELGKVAQARAAVERALPLTEQPSGTDQKQRIQFLLARTLWSEPSQRPRARAIAQAVQAAWTAEGDSDAAVVASWLADHPLP